MTDRQPAKKIEVDDMEKDQFDEINNQFKKKGKEKRTVTFKEHGGSLKKET